MQNPCVERNINNQIYGLMLTERCCLPFQLCHGTLKEMGGAYNSESDRRYAHRNAI